MESNYLILSVKESQTEIAKQIVLIFTPEWKEKYQFAYIVV
jgi:hypothetical protein